MNLQQNAVLAQKLRGNDNDNENEENNGVRNEQQQPVSNNEKNSVEREPHDERSQCAPHSPHENDSYIPSQHNSRKRKANTSVSNHNPNFETDQISHSTKKRKINR
jgi:hypothetical protein